MARKAKLTRIVWAEPKATPDSQGVAMQQMSDVKETVGTVLTGINTWREGGSWPLLTLYDGRKIVVNPDHVEAIFSIIIDPNPPPEEGVDGRGVLAPPSPVPPSPPFN